MCIRVLGTNRRYGHVGDIIIGVVKDATPTVEPVIARPQGIGVARHAPRPHAAMLFVDFMLSPEAQAMMADMGRVPVSRAVKADTGITDYVMSDPAVILDENAKWQALWDRHFMGK